MELNGGAQRARHLRPRCIRGGSPETATPIYHLTLLIVLPVMSVDTVICETKGHFVTISVVG
jgi:hypothetical protein